jgi:hypothetical protein
MVVFAQVVWPVASWWRAATPWALREDQIASPPGLQV